MGRTYAELEQSYTAHFPFIPIGIKIPHLQKFVYHGKRDTGLMVGNVEYCTTYPAALHTS